MIDKRFTKLLEEIEINYLNILVKYKMKQPKLKNDPKLYNNKFYN